MVAAIRDAKLAAQSHTLAGCSTELFPTSHRALASSAAAIAGAAGACISLVLGAQLIGLTGSLARSVALLAAGPLLALVIVAADFPETAGRPALTIVAAL